MVERSVLTEINEEEEDVVEVYPFYLKFCISRTRWSEIADFQSIFARSDSAV